MHRTEASLIRVVVAIVAFCIIYEWTPPTPRYYPLEQVWRMENLSSSPSMGWYGRSAWGFGAAFVAGGLATWFTRRKGLSESGSTRLSRGMITTLSLVALASIALLTVSIIRHEFDRFGVWEMRSPPVESAAE